MGKKDYHYCWRWKLWIQLQGKKYQKELEERDISIIFYNKGIAYLDNKIISDRFSKSVEKKVKNRKFRYSLILVGRDGGVKTYIYMKQN